MENNVQSHQDLDIRTCKHKEYRSHFQATKSTTVGTLYSHGFIDENAHNLHDWVKWIIERNQPFSEVEDPMTRKLSRLEPICVKTLQQTMETLALAVETKIVKEIPDIFGICIDGWTNGSRHFCAIFATYAIDGTCFTPLLAMSPLLDEDSLDADAHVDFIDATLAQFGEDKTSIAFLTANNCATNASIAKKMKVPLVGRIRLAGQLKRFTDLLPVTRNITRWSSTFQMVRRYCEILPFVTKINDLRDIVLTRNQNTKIDELLVTLEQFETVTKKLQSSNLDLADARTMFNGLHLRYPHLPHLSSNAEITRYPDFDNGVEKVLTLREVELSCSEIEALRVFEKKVIVVQPSTVTAATKVATLADELLTPKRQCLEKNTSNYIDLKFVLPTSNIVERLFSMAKFILTDSRKHMHPSNFEKIIFLRVNSSYWGVHTLSSFM